MSCDERNGVIKACILSQKSLDLLRIRCPNEVVEDLCGSIGSGLFELGQIQQIKDRMKIEMRFECKTKPNTKNIVMNVLNMINFLQSATKHFMVKIEFGGENKPNDIDETLSNLPNSFENLKFYSRNNDEIVFTNKQCIINGYRTLWIRNY